MNGQNEHLDINEIESFTATSFKELIEDKTENKENAKNKVLMPYTLARVVTVDDLGNYYVHYFDAEVLNQYLFPNKEKFPSDAQLRQHLIRKKNPLNNLRIQDVQYFILNNMQQPQFKYHGNVNEYAVVQIPQQSQLPYVPAAAAAAAAPRNVERIPAAALPRNARHAAVAAPVADLVEQYRNINIDPLYIPENHRFILNYMKDNLNLLLPIIDTRDTLNKIIIKKIKDLDINSYYSLYQFIEKDIDEDILKKMKKFKIFEKDSINYNYDYDLMNSRFRDIESDLLSHNKYLKINNSNLLQLPYLSAGQLIQLIRYYPVEDQKRILKEYVEKYGANLDIAQISQLRQYISRLANLI